MSASKRLLPFVPPGLVVAGVHPSSDRIVVVCRTRAAAARCPECREPSSRLHSRYERRLADLPWQGRQVVVRLAVRRLRCANRRCPRHVFAEPAHGAAARHARRTVRLGDIQRHVGLALGGEAGARLVRRLAMPTSPDTLIRLVRRGGPDEASAPRVLGVDDWAWRRGQSYGTALVDLERRRVVDLLPDRDAATLARWLHGHPGVEVVARDRAGAHATGARAGTPGAVQVADRWHLLRNCSDALLAAVERRHRLLRDAARAVVAAIRPPEPAPAAGPPPPNKAKRRQAEGHARRQARFDAVAELRRRGLSVRAIRKETGLSRNTLRRWLRAGEAPPWRTGQRAHGADAHAEYLRGRWADGCRNATRLWREVRDRGYRGQVSGFRGWVAKLLREGAHERTGAVRRQARPVWHPPPPRRTVRLLATDAARLRGGDRPFVDALLSASPALAAAAGLARRFGEMVKGRDAGALAPWLADAQGSLLADFAASLRRDREAVEAALATPWSTGPVEGAITRLKLIKRSMYGRAGIELLRQRVVHS